MWVLTLAKVKANLIILPSGLGLHEYLPVTHWRHDWHGFGIQLVVCLWELVPRYETAHPADYGQDYESESGMPCFT